MALISGQPAFCAEKVDPARQSVLRHAQMMTRKTNFKESEVQLTRYLSKYPDDALAYFLRGNERQADGRPALAIEDFSKAAQIKKIPYAYFDRASCYVHIFDYPHALADFTTFIAIQPKNPSGYFQRGRVRYILRDYDGTVKDTTQALKLSPSTSLIHIYRGRAYEALGDNAQAMEDYRQASLFDEKLAQSYYMAPNASPLERMDKLVARAITLDKRGEYEQAILDCHRAIKANPTDPLPCVIAGNIRCHQKEYRAAVKDYTMGWLRNNMERGVLQGRTEAYTRLGDYERALADVGKLIWLDPDLPEPFYQKATLMEKIGKPAVAKTAYKEYIDTAERYTKRSAEKHLKPSSADLDPEHLKQARARLSIR